MKIRIYWILSGKEVGIYNLTFAGEDVRIEHMIDIIKDAKRRFGMKGKQYIILAGDKTFYASKAPKTWYVKELDNGEQTDV